MDTDKLAADITAYLADVRDRARAAGKITKWGLVELIAYMDGCGYVRFAGTAIGAYDVPLAESFRRVEAWLERDEIAEANLTLGLTADGRFSGPHDND